MSWTPYRGGVDDEEDRTEKQAWLPYWTAFISLVPFVLIVIFLSVGLGHYSGFRFSWAQEKEEYTVWKTFNWHPLLMALSFGTIFSHALLAFKLLPTSWFRRKIVHMGLQWLSWTLATTGIAVAHNFKIADHQEEFYTTHAWIGIGTYGLFTLQLLLGTLFFYRPQLFLCVLPVHENFLRDVLPWHILAGLGIYLGAVAAILTGILNRQWLYYFVELADGGVSVRNPTYYLSNWAALGFLMLGWTVYYFHRKRRNYAVEDSSYVAMDQ